MKWLVFLVALALIAIAPAKMLIVLGAALVLLALKSAVTNGARAVLALSAACLLVFVLLRITL